MTKFDSCDFSMGVRNAKNKISNAGLKVLYILIVYQLSPEIGDLDKRLDFLIIIHSVSECYPLYV